VDVDAGLLQSAKRNGLSTQQGSFEAIPFDDSFFDAVLMIDTLEHVESRERTFCEVKRVLKPAGRFVAITPNYASLLWNAAEPIALAISRRAASGHISPFTSEALRYWLKRHFSSYRIGKLNAGMWLYGMAETKA
jgi:ubiquinone/menaquinone biosynthesis C-methylase UbiE